MTINPPTTAFDTKSDVDFWSIGQMSKTFGVTARALRFYEDKAMIQPKRVGQTRLYGARDRARLKLILLGKSIGLPLDEIHNLIDLYDVDPDHRIQLQASLEKFEAQALVLRQQRADLDAAIAMLDERIDWMRTELAKPPVSSEDARAYEKVARASLEGHHNQKATITS